MNLLAIDIGNSRIKAAVFEGDRITDRWWLESRREAVSRSADGLAARLSRCPAPVGALALASVVPELTPAVASAAREALGVEPVIVEAGRLAGAMAVDVERPADVGIDRLLNALAVYAEFGGPAIAVDLGTAATFDVVAGDGTYLGGAIAPGPGMARDALHRGTARLPHVDLRRPARAIGRDTVSAMQSGVVNGYIGLVSGLLAALRAELLGRSADSARVTVVATGGYSAEAWIGSLPGIDAVDPDLTIRGLRLAHARLAPTAGVTR